MVFFMEAVQVQQLQDMLEEAQEVYARSCSGTAAYTFNCEELKDAMEQAEDAINVLLHLPLIYYVQGITYILAGVLGVWAVCFDSARAAKVYMFSWPVKFLLGVWTMLELLSSMKKYGMAQQGHVVAMMLLNIFFLLYFFKVSRSYYHRLDHKNSQSGSSSSGGGGGGGGGGGASTGVTDPAVAILTVNSTTV